jgi:hypothetical protein
MTKGRTPGVAFGVRIDPIEDVDFERAAHHVAGEIGEGGTDDHGIGTVIRG